MSGPYVLGIDGELLWGPTGGIARYVREVVTRIGGVDARNRYKVLYFFSTRRRAGRPLTLASPNVSYRIVRMPFRVLDRLDASAGRLRWELLAGRLDACLFAGRTFHPLRNGHNVGVVWDLTWLSHPETMQSSAVAATWELMTRRMLDGAHSIVTISAAVRDGLEELGVSPERISVAMPGVDTSMFQPRPSDDVEAVRDAYGLRDGYALFVSTIEPRKNIPRLIDAWSRLPASVRGERQLAIVGKLGWGTEPVIQRLDGARSVVHLSSVADEHLAALYSGASLFVLPSLSEGFGLTALEAMACGVPAVVSDIPALREATGGHALFIDDPTRTQSISETLSVALQGGARVEGMARSALTYAANRSWEATAASINSALVAAAEATE